MTISNATSKVEYTGAGAGSPGPFAFPFKVFDQTHLIVTKRSAADPPVTTILTIATHYTVSGVGEANGSVLLTADLEADEVLLIRRAPPLTQLIDLRNQGPYFGATVEDEFDLMVMQIQGVSDDTDIVLDSMQDQLDAFDVRLDVVEAQIQELLDAQLLEQSAAALPVPFLLEAATADLLDDGLIARLAAGLQWEIDVATSADFEADMVEGYPRRFIDPGTDLKLLANQLEPDTTYHARVRGVRGVSLGPDSNVITFTTRALFAVTSTADLVTYDGVYSYHYFNTTGAHHLEIVEGSNRVRALIVAAGGMGGGTNGSGNSCGGGGGGGVKDIDFDDWVAELGVGTYPVVVGAKAAAPAANNVGVNGGDSSFNGITTVGGGFGGSVGGVKGDGGSGGGAIAGTNLTGGRGRTNQGSDGGMSHTAAGGGGGGGGGADRLTGDPARATALKGANGGDGYLSDIDDLGTRYGAGGGGARNCDAFGVIVGTTFGTGGIGGGGNGSNGNAQGAPGTGYGSGGGGAHGNNRGGLAADGRVVIKHRGRALNVTILIPDDPPVLMWRGPITMLTQTIDGVDIEVIHAALGDNAGEFKSTDNPVLGQRHTGGGGDANDFNDGFPFPAYYAKNSIGFKFSQPIRRFRITLKTPFNHLGGFGHRLFGASDIAPDAYNVQDGKVYYGDGLAANGGVATVGGDMYTTFFGEIVPNRKEIRWTSGASFKAAVVHDNWAAWGGPPSNPSWPDAMATVPHVYGEVYFLLAADDEVAGEDTWEP